MAQQTILNGNRFSHVNLSLSFGNIYSGNLPFGVSGGDVPRGVIKSLNYKASKDPGKAQGNQVVQVGRTQGMGLATGDMEIYVSEFDDLMKRITQNGQYAIMDVDFDLTASYSINDIDVRQDILIGTRIVDIGSASQSGNDAHTKTLQLDLANINFNGLYAFSDPSQ